MGGDTWGPVNVSEHLVQPVAGMCCWEDRWRTGRTKGRTRVVVLMAPVCDRTSDQARGDLNLSRAGWTGQTGPGEPFLTQLSPLSGDL